MKNLYGLTAAVFGTAATIVLIQPHAAFAALSATQVDAIARQVTVRIDGQNPGSGVIIAKGGQIYYILTAEHVVRTPDEYYVLTPDDKSYKIDYSRVKKLPGLDLAVLTFTSAQTYRVVAIGSSRQLKEGTVAYVGGFPLQGTSTKQTRYQFSTGEIAAQASRPLDNGYALAYLNDTFVGMSGGPVLDQQGQLVGIHGASKTRFAENQGINPTSGRKFGLNLGIPIDAFLRSASQIIPELKLPAASAASVSVQMKAADLFIQAVDHAITGKAKEASLSIDQVIRLQPNYAAAYFIRGGFRQVDNDQRGAIADYDQAIRLNFKNADVYSNRGGARDELGDKQGAIADYNQAIRLNPNSADAYVNRGAARYSLGDRQGAVSDLDQAIRLNPNHAIAYSNRGVVRNELNDKQGAIADLDQAIRLNPNYAEAYYNRGNAHADLGDKQGAIADLDQAIRLNPNLALAYNNRGKARYELGDRQGAFLDLQRAAELAQAQGNTQVYEIAISNLKVLQR
jgi:tetratricopeptide (TPR) repeat protein